MSVDISKALEIPGWMTEDELRWLAERAAEHHIIAEVGVFCGRTTKALATNPNNLIIAYDIWQPSQSNMNSVLESDKEAYEFFKQHLHYETEFFTNLRDELINEQVFTRLAPFSRYSRKYDMIFIDADHRYEYVKDDILHALKSIAPGGLICGHDYGDPHWPDVKQAVDDVLIDNFTTINRAGHAAGSIWYFELEPNVVTVQ